jgi:hypothetical protein
MIGGWAVAIKCTPGEPTGGSVKNSQALSRAPRCDAA